MSTQPAYAFRAYPAACFQGFQAAVAQGPIRFDLYPQKRGSKCVQMNTKARTRGRHFGAPILAFSDLRNCAATQEGRGPLAAPSGSVHPLCVCTLPRGSDNGHDNPCCYMTAPLLASVPVLSGGSAACSTKGGGGERIGMEWVFDKSFLDFSLYTYIFILLRWIIRRRFSRQRIIRRRKRQQRCKAGKAHQSCLARCRFYRAEAGIIVQTSKVVNR